MIKHSIYNLEKTSTPFNSNNNLKKPSSHFLSRIKEIQNFKLESIDWNSNETHLILNSRFPHKEKSLIKKVSLPYFQSHIWLSSSGSSRTSTYHLKLIALSKSSFLKSAKSVNEHIKSQDKDIWLNALPLFHVGGLSIFARAYLSKAKVFHWNEKKWNPKSFVKALFKSQATLTSLVPSQIWDIVSLNEKAPQSLRVAFVGGEALSPFLYSHARSLGWNILPTYGMTECASQIATAELSSLKKNSPTPPLLKILPHLKIRFNKKNEIQVKGFSLFTGWSFVYENKSFFEDPKKEGWFNSKDLGCLKKLNQKKEASLKSHSYLHFKGRSENKIKIGGEFVNLNKLTQILESLSIKNQFTSSFALLFTPSPRLNYQIDLVVERKGWKNLVGWIKEFQNQVMPYERIRTIYAVEKIKTTPLKKKNQKIILTQIGF